jgi:hypothetical protein
MLASRSVAAVAALVLAHESRAPTDACSLLTSTEVNATLGASLGPGSHPFGTGAICEWADTPNVLTINKRVRLSITDPQRYATAKTPIQGIAKIPVSGLGDDAFYATVGALGTTLEVLKGGNAFTINVAGQGWTADQEVAMEQALARHVITRL